MPRAGTSRNDLDPARLRSYLRARGIKTDSPRLRSLELLAEYAGGSVVDASAQHSTTATPNLIGERWESPWPPLSV